MLLLKNLSTLKLTSKTFCRNYSHILKNNHNVHQTVSNWKALEFFVVSIRQSSTKTKDIVFEGSKESPATPEENTDLNATFLENTPSLDRNFVTLERGISEFLLKPSDFENIRKVNRRSPYDGMSNLVVYWRKEVEAKALQIYGSKEKIQEERLKRKLEKISNNEPITFKILKNRFMKMMNFSSNPKGVGLDSPEGKMIMMSIIFNGLCCLIKFVAWHYTGSNCIFAEGIHSAANMLNQVILTYAVKKSIQKANTEHPYGYIRILSISLLISNVVIFSVFPLGLFCNGYISLSNPQLIEVMHLGFAALLISLTLEGYMNAMFFKTFRRKAEALKISFKDYINKDHDLAAKTAVAKAIASVLGILTAGSCMALSDFNQSGIPDVVGSILIGSILSTVSLYSIYIHSMALVYKSMPQSTVENINRELEGDIVIRAVHDVKVINMGGSQISYKAEIDLDSRNLTQLYLNNYKLEKILEEMKQVKNVEMLEEFFLRHGEGLVDNVGNEIKRIENKLKKTHTRMRHCDLEIV